VIAYCAVSSAFNKGFKPFRSDVANKFPCPSAIPMNLIDESTAITLSQKSWNNSSIPNYFESKTRYYVFDLVNIIVTQFQEKDNEYDSIDIVFVVCHFVIAFEPILILPPSPNEKLNYSARIAILKPFLPFIFDLGNMAIII
jgi:hypothetical protein